METLVDDVDPSNMAFLGVPDCELVQRLASRNDLTRTGFDVDMPLFLDPEVRRASGARGSSFTADRIGMQFYAYEGSQNLTGAMYFGPQCEGPYGAAHGGSIASGLDSAFGFTAMRTMGPGCYTLYLNVTYKRFIPLCGVVQVDVTVESVEQKKILMKATLTSDPDESSNGERVLHAEGEALFYKPRETISFAQLVDAMGSSSGTTKEMVLARLRERQARRAAKQSAKANL